MSSDFGEIAEANHSRALATFADDGCPHHEPETITVPLPRRAGAGLEKKAARDTRSMYAALGALLIEVAPGVYVESGRRPLLLDAENGTHTTVLTILVDKR